MVVSLSVSTVASNNHLNFIIHRSVRYLIELFIKQQVHVEDSSATKFDPIELNLKFHHSVACVNRAGGLGGWGGRSSRRRSWEIQLTYDLMKYANFKGLSIVESTDSIGLLMYCIGHEVIYRLMAPIDWVIIQLWLSYECY